MTAMTGSTAETGFDTIYGGGGTDTIDYSGFSFLRVDYSHRRSNLTTGRWTSILSPTEIIEGFENVEGSQGVENIHRHLGRERHSTATPATTRFRGSGGQDTIDGGAGDDTVYWESNPSLLSRSISGGTGSDTINGDGVNFGTAARVRTWAPAPMIPGSAIPTSG